MSTDRGSTNGPVLLATGVLGQWEDLPSYYQEITTKCNGTYLFAAGATIREGCERFG